MLAENSFSFNVFMGHFSRWMPMHFSHSINQNNLEEMIVDVSIRSKTHFKNQFWKILDSGINKICHFKEPKQVI